MIDTHAHVHARAFDRDRADVMARAWKAGVSHFLEVNIDAAGWPRCREVVRSDPRVRGTAGIHPHDVQRARLEDLDFVTRALDEPGIVAVGETGLDSYRDYAPYDDQRAFFERQVAIARECRKPLVVHARQKQAEPRAHPDVLEILEREGRGAVTGVLHCFSGDLEMARRAADLGFRLGIGGAITYARERSAPLLRSIGEALGISAFVLETDCPYLTPHPNRNERNEPAYIPAIAAALAAYLGVSVEDVERETDRAAKDLFGFAAVEGPGGGSDSA